MSDYPEHDKQAQVVDQTQAIGEFLDWLSSQGVNLMIWREDLTDTRPTDPDCRARRREGHKENRQLSCWPTQESDVGSADYYDTHCLHWHGREYEAGDDCGAEPGTCCFCGKGRFYEVTGLKSWVHEPRSIMQLLADWAGIDLKKIDEEKRQMLAALREMNAKAGLPVSETHAADDYARRINDLRVFEREYRSRLRGWLIQQLGLLNAPYGEGLLDSDQRWSVEEARGILREWDQGRRDPERLIHDREGVLAAQIRALLSILDQVAPKPEGG